ncbi:capsule biosynthesis protein CapA [Abditibacteriota bacterium]|nr:capsule biosynthesis protein CapA [Abditibacteriota bacterium]
MPLPLSLVLVGDILTGRGVAPLLKSPQSSVWRYQSLIAGADLAWGNLEAAPRSAQTGRKPFYNAGDLGTLRSVGFDGFNLANNHSLDAGSGGARQTARVLASLGLKGAGLSLDSSNPVPTWNVSGRRVALVGATQWGPFVKDNVRLTRLETGSLCHTIRELTAQGVFVVASLHWGTEGVATISPQQRGIAHQLIDAGAIAVWGHHPHIVGPIESYKGHPIFASTGNFLWDTMPAPQSGLVARLQIEGETPQSAKVSWKTWRIDPQVRALKAPPTPKGETRVGAFVGRFDANNSRLSWIVWTRNRRSNPVLRAMEPVPGGWRVRAMGLPREVRGIQIGDLNGDGRDEVVVELFQRSKLDPQNKPRFHVYDVEPNRFKPLWRGSMLSRPFFAWCLVGRGDDIARDVAALERGQHGLQWLTLYRWNGFGLRAVWQQSFEGQLSRLQSGCDAQGTFLSLHIVTRSGAKTLHARRISGENWRVEDTFAP